MSSTLMPVCTECGDKFPGDPCKACGYSPADIALDAMFAEADRRERERARESVADKRAARHLRRAPAKRRKRHGRQ